MKRHEGSEEFEHTCVVWSGHFTLVPLVDGTLLVPTHRRVGDRTLEVRYTVSNSSTDYRSAQVVLTYLPTVKYGALEIEK